MKVDFPILLSFKQLGSHKGRLPNGCPLITRWVKFSVESSAGSKAYTSH